MSIEQINEIFFRPAFDKEDIDFLHKVSKILKDCATLLENHAPKDTPEKIIAFRKLREASAACGIALSTQLKYDKYREIK